MESLDTLNRYSAKNFEIWLKKQLRQVYFGSSEDKYRACDFRHLGVSRGESHIDALQGLFKKLSDNARERFKEALGRILQHVKPDDFPCEAMADIIMLTGLTAAYDVFPTFVPVLGSGYWGEIQPSLIYDALSVLMMFDRSNEAYRSAKGLATSIHFPNALVFDAYLVMIRARPQNWGVDFALLRDRFSKIIDQVNSSADAKMFEQLYRRQFGLAKSLSEAVPMSELGEQLATLSETGSWLISFLLNRKIFCLKGSDDFSGIHIIDHVDPTRKAKVETTSSFEVKCIEKGWFYSQNPNSQSSSSEAKLLVSSADKELLRILSARSENTCGINSQNRYSLPSLEKVCER